MRARSPPPRSGAPEPLAPRCSPRPTCTGPRLCGAPPSCEPRGWRRLRPARLGSARLGTARHGSARHGGGGRRGGAGAAPLLPPGSAPPRPGPGLPRSRLKPGGRELRVPPTDPAAPGIPAPSLSLSSPAAPTPALTSQPLPTLFDPVFFPGSFSRKPFSPPAPGPGPAAPLESAVLCRAGVLFLYTPLRRRLLRQAPACAAIALTAADARSPGPTREGRWATAAPRGAATNASPETAVDSPFITGGISILKVHITPQC